MGTVVDVAIPPPEFALAQTFETVPDATVETVRVAAHSPGRVLSVVWAGSETRGPLRDVLAGDRTTADVEALFEQSTRGLYHVTWAGSVHDVLDTILNGKLTLLSATASRSDWELRVLFPNRTAVSVAYDEWYREGVEASVMRVTDITEVVAYDDTGLSSCQHETLTSAFDSGYYEVPRGVTLDELASELGVSHQALSERLRRGHRNLVGSTLYDSPKPI